MKNIFKMTGKSLTAIATEKAVREQLKGELEPFKNFIESKLKPIATQVVIENKVDGVVNGSVESGTVASTAINKMIYVHPFKNIEGWNNNRVNEVLWVYKFLTDPDLKCESWKEVNLKGFVYDAFTGIQTNGKATKPIVSKEIEGLFFENNIRLNTTNVVIDYVNQLIEQIPKDELQNYINFLQGEDEEESEG